MIKKSVMLSRKMLREIDEYRVNYYKKHGYLIDFSTAVRILLKEGLKRVRK